MSGRLRLPLALATAVVVAEAAAVLLRPRSGVFTPAEVSPEGYFSAEQLQRAVDFRGPQLALYGVAVALQLGVLALVVRRPPRWLRRARRPLLTAAAGGAALSLVVNAVALPVSAVSRSRAIDVGLVTQSWPGWIGDVAKSWAIAAVIAAVGAVVAVALLRRFPRRWWLPAAGVVVAFGAVTTYAGPVVLDPLFNRFEPLPAGQVRDDVLDLARRADVDVGEVQVMDASRRTTAANAYVAGLGSTKRVVLYDTLLDNFSREELRLVVAHELGHVHHRDLPKGLLYLLLVAPAGMFAVAALTERLRPRGEPAPSALPALALSLALVVPVVTIISNGLSRRVEARADAFALRMTGEPEALIDFERRITVRNVSDPDPPAWRTWLVGTHPPAVERIGAAEAFRRSEAARSSRPRRTRGGS